MKKFIAIFKARNMEFVRDRGALFWNILFPTLLVVGFAVVFSNGEESVFRVGLVGHGAPPAQLSGLEGVEFIRYDERFPIRWLDLDAYTYPNGIAAGTQAHTVMPFVSGWE